MDGQSFSRGEQTSVVLIAIVAGCVPALQPLLLGALLGEGRIGADSMGHAATAEAFGMAMATAIAGACLRPRRLHLVCLSSLLAVLAANLLTILLPSPGIIAVRGVSGVGNGLLLWVLVGMLARSAVPARLYAIYVTANAALVFLLSAILGGFAIRQYGALAGYVILIAIYGVLLLAVRRVPARYANLGERQMATLPPPAGFLALAGVVLFLAGIMAFWIYAVPLGIQTGIAADTMQLMISAATGVQIVAGLTAVALAGRVTGMQAMLTTAFLALLAVGATLVSDRGSVWLSAMMLFSFCWMFAPAFHIPFLNLADPSRRAAIFVGTAQLGGYAVGPLLGAAAVSASDFGPARLVAMACFATVLAIAGIVRKRQQPAMA